LGEARERASEAAETGKSERKATAIWMGGDAGGVVGGGQDDAEEASEGTRSGIREGHFLEIRKKIMQGRAIRGFIKFQNRGSDDGPILRRACA
jgi:hypothetical protein